MEREWLLNIFGWRVFIRYILVRDGELVEVSSIIQVKMKDMEGNPNANRIQQGTGNQWVFD